MTIRFNLNVEIKPDSHEAYDNMGAAYTELGEFKEAIEAHEKAIKIKPDSHKAYYNMGVAYTELGEFKEAIEAHEKAIKCKQLPYCHKLHDYQA
jgi:tetratricopeptide (TPR) repeat protein